jgi:hypothetical protein
MTPRQGRLGMHQFDYRPVGQIAMLLEAAADRHNRFELQAELFAVEFLHRGQLIREESDIHSLSRKFHRFASKAAAKPLTALLRNRE